MVHGGVRLFFQLLGGLGLILLLGAALLAWRLSQGPLQLDAVTPYLAEALSLPGNDYRIDLGTTLLYWESPTEALDLRVADVRAVDASGTTVAAVPALSLTVAPAALLRGELRLTSVEMIDPHIQLLRDEDGSLRLGLWYPPDEDAEAEVAPAERMEGTAILRALVAGLTGRLNLGPAADLSAVRVAGGRGTLIDRRLDAVWMMPEASIELTRGDGGSIDVAATLAVALPGEAAETTRLDLVGDYDPAAQSVDLGISFSGLRPAALAPVSDDLAPLAAVDLPLDGTVTLTLAVTHTLELRAAGVSASGGRGHIRLPEPYGIDYPVQSLNLSGSVAAELDEIELDALTVVLDPPAEVTGQDGPVTLEVKAALSEAPAPEGGFAGGMEIAVGNVPVDALPQWWPEGVAVNPRGWILKNLSQGRMVEGRWSIGLEGPVIDRVAPTTVAGTAHVEGTRVRYIDEMPPVQAVTADLSFEDHRVDIAARSGRVYGLTVTGGTIALTNLHHPTEPLAEIDLTIGGPLGDALKLVDQPPLGYASKLGVDPGAALGTAETRLRMRFPLIHDLRLDQLEVLAKSTVKDASLRRAVFGRDLTEGNLTLTVDTESLKAEGQAAIAGMPAGFAWHEVFGGQPYRSRYAVRAEVAEDKRHIFGLDFPPFTPAFIQGPAAVDLEYTVVDSALATIGAQVDLAKTRMRLPGFDWTKPPGAPAQATVALRLADGDVRDVSRFTVRSGDDFLADGRVRLSDAGQLDTITFNRLEVEETVLEGTVTTRPDGSFAVRVRGDAFDATPFLAGENGNAARRDDGAAGRRQDSGTGDGEGDLPDLPPVDLEAEIDVVWLSEMGTVEDVSARLHRENGRLQRARVSGTLEGQAPLTFVLGREPGQAVRLFTAETPDAGALLRSIGLLGTVRGGALDLNGRLLDDGRAEGLLRIEEYRLVDAPVLARLLSVAALTGILEALSGEGLAFSQLQAPFIYDEGILTLKDFRTSGPSLGLTGDGTVDLTADRLNLRGTIVPAYALNSLLGRLPLVGGLLSGFEEGGGLFAATYSVEGPVAAPSVAVNPLSALAPGFLRGLFSGGADGAGAEN